MKYKIFLSLFLTVCISCNDSILIKTEISDNQIKYPYPIITINDYANIKSVASSLYDEHLQDDRKNIRPLVGMIRVDGKIYRFMGSGELPDIMVAGMSYDEKWEGKYTFIQPTEGWLNFDYDDSNWDSGLSPFGTPQYHSEFYRQINTLWVTPTIWVRRKIQIHDNALTEGKLYVKCSHDDVLELYINGILIVKTGYEWGENKWIEIPREVVENFHTGNIIIAAKGRNLSGEALLDFGIYIPKNIQKQWNGQYTFSKPEDNWESCDFDDVGWQTGKAPFGSPRDYVVNTVWETPEIWVRRKIMLSPEDLGKDLIVEYSHDDVFDLYVNGIQLVRTGFEWNRNQRVTIPDSLKKSIRDNKLLVAAHCRNLRGGAFVDFEVKSDATASQKTVDVQATQTRYRFECGPVELQLNFTAPFVLNNLEILSRPVNYISYNIFSLDNIEHDVAVYFEIAPGWMFRQQNCMTELYENNGLLFIKTGQKEQQLFTFDKENDSPLWGHFYLCSDELNTSMSMGEPSGLREEFAEKSCLTFAKQAKNHYHAALSKSYGKITAISDKIIIGYDDAYSVQYMGNNLRPYWNRKGDSTMEQVIANAYNDYYKVLQACNSLDKKLRQTQEFNNYRALFASCRIVEDEIDGLLLFPKNGVSDMIYFSSLFLSNNCQLLKAQLTPLLLYCERGIWENKYPPSNMGNYPFVNGFTYSTKSQVETASDMLFLLAMITGVDDSVDYIQRYWLIITQWNDFLMNNKENPDFKETVSRGAAAYNYMKKILSD